MAPKYIYSNKPAALTARRQRSGHGRDAGPGPRLRRALVALVLCVGSGFVLATDGPSWGSLSGEQQYMLGKFHARWDTLERKEREDLLQRLNARRAGLIAQSKTVPAPVAPAVVERRPRSHRGRTVDSVNFHGNSHSLRLLEQLRGVRNLSVDERRDVVQRWPTLTPDERRDLVMHYVENNADEADTPEEVAVARELRNRGLQADSEGVRNALNLRHGVTPPNPVEFDNPAADASGPVDEPANPATAASSRDPSQAALPARVLGRDASRAERNAATRAALNAAGIHADPPPKY